MQGFPQLHNLFHVVTLQVTSMQDNTTFGIMKVFALEKLFK